MSLQDLVKPAITALAVALSPALTAQPPPAPPAATDPASLDWFAGDWAGEGTMFGGPATMTLKVARTAEGLTLDYLAAPQRGPAFEGHGSYKPARAGRWTGQWRDNRGALFELGGRVTAQTLTSLWGSPATEIGRTVYALQADGTLQVTDATLLPDGGWREFAKARYVRAKTGS